jgi:hypothetical protein
LFDEETYIYLHTILTADLHKKGRYMECNLSLMVSIKPLLEKKCTTYIQIKATIEMFERTVNVCDRFIISLNINQTVTNLVSIPPKKGDNS